MGLGNLKCANAHYSEKKGWTCQAGQVECNGCKRFAKRAILQLQYAFDDPSTL
jgi:hypothetical protein